MIPCIQQVQIRNYKSIAQLSVNLEPFTVFVGPNGSGKSNFIDALAFVQECLSESIELAFKNRGGIAAVRRSSTGHPTHITIRLVLNLGDDLFADYAFEIAAKPKEKFSVARERCVVQKLMGQSHSFEIENGRFTTEIPGIRPKVAADRLALFAASATEEVRPVYDFLTSMRFYSIVPVRLRELQEPDTGDFLKRDGSNAAAVLKRLQDVGAKHPWTFNALNMSDGTLRVLGLLLAVYQPGPYSVVAVEEPEATVNPAVAEIVVEVLMDAAHEKQVLLTSHSPDILDYKELTDNQIRVVAMEHGRTLIAPVSQAGRAAIQERLYTPGELLRSGELSPDPDAAEQAAQQLNLFGTPDFGRPNEP